MHEGKSVFAALSVLSVLPILTFAGAALAAPVQITVEGTVEFNQIGAPPLGNANPGDDAILTFTIDSDVFVDSVNFPTRGYPIDESSFVLTMGAATIGLQDPFPGGSTPYFAIRDNDPAVDGFFIADSFEFPTGVPLDQTGVVDQFVQDFGVTYGGDALDSLDVLDAFGVYDFTGLSVFSWSVNDGPFNPLGVVFGQLTIGDPPTPPGVPGLLVRKVGNDDTRLRLTFDDASCDGNADHQLVIGFGSDLPASPGGTFLVSDDRCGVSTPYNWQGVPDPSVDPGGLLWFLVLANDGGTTEGSWGTDSDGIERSGPAGDGGSGVCGMTVKDVSNACGQ
jgi:hypothetical protein